MGQERTQPTIVEFIGVKCTYDKFGGQHLWGVDKTGGHQMIGEVRAWGAIQNLFKTHKGIDFEKAGKFQDELGDWIAAAINEKLQRDGSKEA